MFKVGDRVRVKRNPPHYTWFHEITLNGTAGKEGIVESVGLHGMRVKVVGKRNAFSYQSDLIEYLIPEVFIPRPKIGEIVVRDGVIREKFKVDKL